MKLHNIALNRFFYVILAAFELHSTQTPLYRIPPYKNTVQILYWLSLKNEPSITSLWEGGKEAIPLHFRGRCLEGSHGEMEKNDPSSLMAMREGEHWQLSKQLSVQIRSSESVTQAVSVVNWEDSDPCQQAPQKRGCQRKRHLHLSDAWLPLRVKCSLHASIQFHPSLITEKTCPYWFWYHCGSSWWRKRTSFPLIWIQPHDKMWTAWTFICI